MTRNQKIQYKSLVMVFGMWAFCGHSWLDAYTWMAYDKACSEEWTPNSHGLGWDWNMCSTFRNQLRPKNLRSFYDHLKREIITTKKTPIIIVSNFKWFFAYFTMRQFPIWSTSQDCIESKIIMRSIMFHIMGNTCMMICFTNTI